VAREVASSPLLLVAGYRDVDPLPSAPLRSVLAELSREPAVHRLALGGLDVTAVGEFIQRAAPEVASSAMSAALTERTDGNPLFVGETLRLLVLEHDSGETATDGLTVPPSLHDVIAKRLARLPARCARLLPSAAVLGREFPVDALARMEGVEESELLDTLDDAITTRVVTDVPGSGGRLRFAHVLIRDTLYEDLTPAGRRRLHRRAGEALESIHGDRSGPHLAELALHTLAARDFDRGIAYARRAGDRALALLAYEEAARLYETALAALDSSRPGDEVARCELLLALGEARSRAGDGPGSKEIFLEAASIAERIGQERHFARAALGYGGRMLVVRAGRDDRLVPLLERALELLPPDDIELRSRLLSRLAGACRDERSPVRRDALSREAVELARTSGNDVALAFALEGRAAAILAPDTLEEVLVLGSELVEVGSRTGDPERIIHGHSYRIMTQIAFGTLDDALPDVEHRNRASRELQQPIQLWQTAVDEAMLALAAGRLGEGEELVDNAFAVGERAIPELAVPAFVFQRYVLADFRGRHDLVEPDLRKVVAAHPRRRVFACALVHLHARRGGEAEAGTELDALAGPGFPELLFDQEWLVATSLLAETVTLLGRTDLAPALYESMLPYAALTAIDLPEGIRGSMSRYLGQLAELLGQPERAEGHFEAAIEANGRLGARPWLALTQRDLAHLLRARNAPRDRKRAGQLAAAATATFDELGMSGYR